jgi:hypothetical protein
MMFKNWDWKYILVFALMLVSVVLMFTFKNQILYFFKSVFSFKYLTHIAGFVAAALTIIHKIKTQDIKLNPNMSFNDFRVPVEDILSFVGNPITLVCSISLAKGIFLQYFYNDQYFPFFDSIELTFIGLVTAYLFYLSLMELKTNFIESFTKNIIDTPKPSLSDEGERIIPEPKNPK